MSETLTRWREAKEMKIVERIEYRRYTIDGLKDERKRRGVSQILLANYLGISVQYLCDIEHGRRFIKEKQAKAIVRYLEQKNI